MQKPFKKYAQKHLKRLKNILLEFQDRSDLELLHQARVEVKKIKALINLIGFSKPRFNAHAVYVPFRNIHRASEKLWEAEVVHRLMKQYSIHASKTNPAKEIEKFRARHNTFMKLLKKQGRILLPTARKLDKIQYKKYLKKIRSQVRDLVRKGINLTQLHPIRKKLKELYYLQSIFFRPKSIDPIYRQGERHIGHWLDQKLLIARLTKSKVNAPIIAVLQSEMKTELKEIRAELKSF